MTRKYILSFNENTADRPLVHDLIRKYDIIINILKAEISPIAGSMLAEFSAPEAEIDRSLDFLRSQGVDIALVMDQIIYREDQCVQCGSCANACFSKALTMEAPDWKLQFNKDKCILCKFCLTACPQKLFSIATA